MDNIVQGHVGAETAYDLDFVGGKLVFNVKYNGAQASAGFTVGVSIDLLMDKVKDKIPGKVDDAIIELLKGALKAL